MPHRKLQSWEDENRHMRFYLFFREGMFYPIALKDDEDARRNAIWNPGTIRVEDSSGNIIWQPPKIH